MLSRRDGKTSCGNGDLVDYTMSNRSTWQVRVLPSVVLGASVLKVTGASRSVTGSRSVIGTELINMSFKNMYKRMQHLLENESASTGLNLEYVCVCVVFWMRVLWTEMCPHNS